MKKTNFEALFTQQKIRRTVKINIKQRTARLERNQTSQVKQLMDFARYKPMRNFMVLNGQLISFKKTAGLQNFEFSRWCWLKPSHHIA
jgi:hypothetical protein